MNNLDQITARHLLVFNTFMTSHGLKEAALKLNCSMPAVSKSLHQLEQIVGKTLFSKTGNRLIPSEEAQKILPYVQNGLTQFNLARQMFLETTHSPIHLKIGAGGGAIADLIPQALKRFAEIHPNVHIEIISASTQKLLHLISNHQLDLAICTPTPQDTSPDILNLCSIEEISENPLIAAIHQSDPLCKKTFITPADLADKQLITIYAASPTTLMLKAAFRDAAIEPNFAITVSDSISACYLINAQIGIGFIHPEILKNQVFPEIKPIYFAPRISMRTLAYIPKNKNDRTLIDLFVSLIKQQKASL